MISSSCPDCWAVPLNSPCRRSFPCRLMLVRCPSTSFFLESGEKNGALTARSPSARSPSAVPRPNSPVPGPAVAANASKRNTNRSSRPWNGSRSSNAVPAIYHGRVRTSGCGEPVGRGHGGARSCVSSAPSFLPFLPPPFPPISCPGAGSGFPKPRKKFELVWVPPV